MAGAHAPADGVAGRAERAVVLLAEIPAALLVIGELVLLAASVVFRYGLDAPLYWSDELATILFLWLGMLGAVVGLGRGQHMRMTALINRAGPHARMRWDRVSLVASLVFFALILVPAFDYMQQESMVTTAALHLDDALRVAAIPAAIVLMIVLATLRLARSGWRAAVAGVLLAAVVAVAFSLVGPVLAGLGNLNLVLFFVGVLGFTVLSGMPIAFSFGLATFSYLAVCTSAPLSIVVTQMDQGMSELILLAVPMFVFLGLLIEMVGMAAAMVAFLAALIGHVRGGLSFVLIGAMYLVSGISGSKTADMAAVAPVLFPEMIRRGARPGDLVALMAATGAQTETIPPSIVLITLGSVTGVSISGLFTGGLLPGLVLGAVLCVLVAWRARGEPRGSVPRASRRVVLRAALAAVPALLLPVLIRFAVVRGIATATEVSAIGVCYALLVGALVYRRMDLRRLWPMLVETAALSGAILMIIGTATAMAWALTQSGFSRSLAAMMTTLPGGKATFLAVSVIAFIILGSVLEGIPAVILFGPLLFPIARAVGVNEIHYAMVVVLSMGLGLFSPPFGVGYYGACTVSRIHPDSGMRPIVGYMVALLIGIAIIAAVPWLSTGFLK